jgi:hypothetical protein
MELAHGTLTQTYLRMKVTDLARRFAEDPAAIDMRAISQDFSHVLFTLTPNDDDRSIYTSQVTSPYLCGIIGKQIAQLKVIDQVSFYQKASTLPQFRGTWGYMFETYFLAWLHSTAEQADALTCTAKSTTSATPVQTVKSRKSKRIGRRSMPKADNQPKLCFHPLECLHPLGRDKVIVFNGDSNFQKAGDFEPPFGFLPASRTFPSFDAVICTDEHIITIQLTVSPTHTMKPDGFERLKQYLPTNFEKARTWCHVFVTDRNANATSLRKENHKVAVDKNISIYTAVLNVPACKFSPEDMERTFTPSVCWHKPLYVYFGTHLGVIRMSLLRWTPVGWT